MIAHYWPYLFGYVGVLFILALLALEWIGRRDATRAEQRRQQALEALGRRPEDHASPWDLDAMSRGREDRR